MRKLKFLLILFVLLFVSQEALAQNFVFSKNRLLKVASGTFTAANARTSYVAGTAFVDANGTDFSAYAGTDLGSTPYKICFTDASGDKAWGFLGAVGGGEALATTGGPLNDGELLTNPSFDDNATGWDAVNDTLASSHPAGGGQSDDYLIMTWVSGGYQLANQLNVGVSTGALHKVSIYKKSGTSGNEACACTLNLGSAPWTTWLTISGNTTASWVGVGGYTVALNTPAYISLQKLTVTAGTMLWDEISVKQVIDCAVTGLHVMSTRNGTVRNWQSIDANFGYNDAMSWTAFKAY